MDEQWSPEVRAAAGVLEQLRSTSFRGSVTFHFSGGGGPNKFALAEFFNIAEVGSRQIAIVAMAGAAAFEPQP